jgi:creatinine amidohydrolase/Fe(II)-dependent formamide hydrolase-like protein
MTNTGAMGHPERATREKGNQLFQLISQSVIEFLAEFSNWKIPRELPNA